MRLMGGDELDFIAAQIISGWPRRAITLSRGAR
jgi:hypothetical protein